MNKKKLCIIGVALQKHKMFYKWGEGVAVRKRLKTTDVHARSTAPITVVLTKSRG